MIKTFRQKKHRLLVLIVSVVLMLSTFTLSCHTFGSQSVDTTPPTKMDKIKSVVGVGQAAESKLTILPALGIVAASISVAVIFLGATKIGLAGLVASVFGTVMSLSVASFSNVFAIGGLVGVVVLGLVMVRRTSKANTQMVTGIQELKKILPHDQIVEVLSNVQTDDVKGFIKDVKNKLGYGRKTGGGKAKINKKTTKNITD